MRRGRVNRRWAWAFGIASRAGFQLGMVVGTTGAHVHGVMAAVMAAMGDMAAGTTSPGRRHRLRESLLRRPAGSGALSAACKVHPVPGSVPVAAGNWWPTAARAAGPCSPQARSSAASAASQALDPHGQARCSLIIDCAGQPAGQRLCQQSASVAGHPLLLSRSG